MKKTMKRLMALCVCCAICLGSVAALADGWVQSSGRWWYSRNDGSYPRSEWMSHGSTWYYFDQDGWMATGWRQIGGTWYYFDGSGAMATGWRQIGGTWYYFDGSGAMATGWRQIGGTWYYFDGSGAMATGWRQIGGTWYSFDGSGAMATGWRQIGGAWYCFDGSGAMATGWRQIGGTWYSFDDSGVMATGWRQIGGKWYYFDGSGAMVTGTRQISGTQFTFDESGVCRENEDESMLKGAERIGDLIWSAVREGDTEKALPILTEMGYDEQDEKSWIADHRNAANAMTDKHIHIIAQDGDICIAEMVHYLVTFTNAGTKSNEQNSGHWLQLRKVGGKWVPTTFTEEEAERLDVSYSKHFTQEAQESVQFTRFGNMMWTAQDGVEKGIITSQMAYLYQTKDGNVVAMVALANGKGTIEKVTRITVTITDDQLGQVINKTVDCDVTVLPGTVETYAVQIPASQVKKGNWTTMHADVSIHY